MKAMCKSICNEKWLLTGYDKNEQNIIIIKKI